MNSIREIKHAAWSRVTQSFGAAFLLALIPFILEFGSSASTARDQLRNANTVTSTSGSIGKSVAFDAGTIITIIVAVLISLIIVFAILALFIALIEMFAESSTVGFLTWSEEDEKPVKPFIGGLTLINGTVYKIAYIRAIYSMLWALLFFIPGIIKSFSYSQAILIYRDDVKNNRDIRTARQYLKASAEMMNGYKGHRFLLSLSLIGWSILTALTGGILAIFTTPYFLAVNASFYQNLRGLRDAQHINDKSTVL